MTGTPAVPATSTADAPLPLRRRLAVVAMAVGTFALVTVESLPVGLLPFVGGDLHVFEGTAALMVTVPGLVAVVTAPLLPVVMGRLDRRIALVALVALMVLANALCAPAPDFTVLLGSRFLVGISIGGFWALAAGVAVRPVPERLVPRAVSVVFGGATAANVLGVPAGTLIGGLADWRTAFAAAGALGLLVLAALLLLLPTLPARQAVRLRALAQQFGHPPRWCAPVSSPRSSRWAVTSPRSPASAPSSRTSAGSARARSARSCSASARPASSATSSPARPRNATSAPPSPPSAPC
ncbi:MFS transporter [Kitasatospora hibisci]|uniref:MFS transporter n=1 Tax=Kitasatospora hibisci TaxID=3369522 RepID=UPI003753ED37